MKPIENEPRQGGFRGRRGDPSNAQKCGAKTRRGTPCQRAAERNQGRFLLRIEDIDIARSRPEYEQSIKDDLVNAGMLSQLKKGVLLVNAAR